MVWTPAKTSLKRRSLAVVKNYSLNLLAIYLILQCREAFTMIKRFRLSPLMRDTEICDLSQISVASSNVVVHVFRSNCYLSYVIEIDVDERAN